MTPKKRQRGVAAVEFGILIIPLTLMLFGLAEYGRAIYQYNTVLKAVRDATRYLSTLAAGEVNALGVNEWNKAECLVRYGNTACSGQVLAPGLDETEGKAVVDICDATDAKKCPGIPHALVPTPAGSGTVNLVSVTVRNYEFRPLVSFSLTGLGIGAPYITFDPISQTMRQAL